MNSEYNPPMAYSLTQTEKPNFFVIDKISKDNIANHNEKYYLFLIKSACKLIFNNDFLKPILIEADFHHTN